MAAIALPGFLGQLVPVSASIAHERNKDKILEELQRQTKEDQKWAQSVAENIKNLDLKNEDDIPCCCGIKPPCRRFKNLVIFKKSKKEAKEAALHFPKAKGCVLHPHNTTDNLPHFHPTFDPFGKFKIPGVHFQFPK